MKKLLLIISLCCNCLSASGPITHAYLAKIWLEIHGGKQHESNCEFLLGSVYPDVRYVTDMPREKTHKMGVTINDIKQAKTPFLAGCKLHSFIDEQRKKIIDKSKIYAWLEEQCRDNFLLEPLFKQHRYQMLCLLEDEVVRLMFDCKKLTKLFGKIHHEEVFDEITSKAVGTWHLFLINYFEGNLGNHKKIPAKLMKMLFAKFLFASLAKEKRMVQYTRNMVEFSKNLFKNPKTAY